MPKTSDKNPTIPDFTTLDPNNPDVVTTYLITYGYHHLLNIKPNEAKTIDEQSSDFRLMIARYQNSFKKSQNIDPDGKLGPITRKMITKPRCACPDIAPAGAAWEDPCRHNLKIFCEFPNLKTNSHWSTQKDYEKSWYDCFRAPCRFAAEP